MVLKLYNTLTREKEEFRPLDAENVRLYACGPTVYDFAHIGNARPAIVFDVLYRLLRHVYGEDHVTYVRNITDVDDKINKRAAEDFPDLPLNEAIRKVTALTEDQYHADVDALGCLRPTVEPRATEHIPEMKVLIERLVAGGHAYVAEDHVLFDVPSMPNYGELARRSLDEMQAGARVDVAPYKKDAMDFVLWKPSKPGEPAWDSPCGIAAPGRPGWHLECSAMAWKHLGEQFDIHGGGIDLVFPHHENEVAQTCCAFHSDRMAQVWMHNGFLQVEGEKMSKSLGNFVTIRELLDEWPGPALRLTMLQTHYRQPINWTRDGIIAARAEIEAWVSAVFDQPLLARFAVAQLEESIPKPDPAIVDALSDDLNTPKAITALRALYELAKHDKGRRFEFLASLVFLGFVDLRKIGALFPGVSGSAPVKVLSDHRKLYARVQAASANSDLRAIEAANQEVAAEGVEFVVSPNDGLVELNKRPNASVTGQNDEVEALIAARAEARAAKDWAEADRIRDELTEKGIALKDSKDPETGKLVTTWEIAR